MFPLRRTPSGIASRETGNEATVAALASPTLLLSCLPIVTTEASMQAVHPMFGAEEMSSRPLALSFTSAERGMHSSPAARQQFSWQAMLAAGLFVSGTCVGYAVALFQHTHQPAPLVEQKVEQFYAGRERGGTTEDGIADGGRAGGGTAEGINAEGAEAASGCCGPCSSAAPE